MLPTSSRGCNFFEGAMECYDAEIGSCKLVTRFSEMQRVSQKILILYVLERSVASFVLHYDGIVA